MVVRTYFTLHISPQHANVTTLLIPISRLRGARTPEGAFASRSTAEYPPALCASFANIFHAFVSKLSRDFTVMDIPKLLPTKSYSSHPYPRHDGGGYVSTGDSSAPQPGIVDSLQTLRRNWMQLIISQNLDKQLMGHTKMEHAPFQMKYCFYSRSFSKNFFLPTVKILIGRFLQINPWLCMFYCMFYHF